jgi:hypothetical protein
LISADIAQVTEAGNVGDGGLSGDDSVYFHGESVQVSRLLLT